MPEKGQVTARELQILALSADGHSNAEIAYMLNIEMKTVEVHKYSLMKRLSAKSTTHAVAMAFRNNWIK